MCYVRSDPMEPVIVGKKFKYKEMEFKVISIDNGLIVAECLEKGVVPVYQPFRLTEGGEFMRC